MIIALEPTSPEVSSTPATFHDLFICPICGAVGITGNGVLVKLNGHHGFVANRAATFLEFSYTRNLGQQEY